MKEQSVEQLCAEGTKLLESGKIDDALLAFTSGLSLTKQKYKLGILHYNIALCHAKRRQTDLTLTALTDAIKASPSLFSTIRRGSDFPHLLTTPEFTQFVIKAGEYRKRRNRQTLQYVLAGVIAFAIWGLAKQTYPEGKGTLFFLLMAAACGGLIQVFRFRKRLQDAESADSFAHDTASVSADKDTSSDPGTFKCPQCGRTYDPAGYRSDVEHIFCTACNAELPRNRPDKAS